jgi:hypothetical protein
MAGSAWGQEANVTKDNQWRQVDESTLVAVLPHRPAPKAGKTIFRYGREHAPNPTCVSLTASEIDMHSGRSYCAEAFSRFSLTPTCLGNKLVAEVSPFEARLPLRSPNAVSLEAKLRIER